MAYTAPPLAVTQAAVTTAGWNAIRDDLADHQGRITTLETAPAPASGGTLTGGYIYLDSYTQASDDDKLTAAMADAQAATYRPTIRLMNRAYTFAIQRVLYDGFRIEGPPGYSNAEKGSANMACQVTLNGGGVWLTGSSTASTFDVYVGQIDFKGSSSTQFMASPTQTLYCCMLRDLTFSGFKSVLGSQAAKMLITLCQFDGYWEVNNSYNGAIHLGGSDNIGLWPAGMALDSGTAFATAGAANGQYHLWLDGLEKSTIGPLYITAEGAWNGVRVTGSGIGSTSNNQGGPLDFWSPKIEGRNAGAPCNGSLLRVEGGIVNINGGWISYGMASPATPGHSPADAGIIHQTGGQLSVSKTTYDHASAVAEAVPFIYSAGGIAYVDKIWRASKGGVWTGLPRYTAAGGTVNADASVTAV